MANSYIDLNCDLGESFGAYHLGADEQILPYISSANIACGFHAGDPSVMRKTVKLAMQHKVAIGAHPGLPDLVGFGRRMMVISPEEAFDLIVYQVGALWAFVQAEAGKLHHVKPHGALYNMAAVNGRLAEAIAEAIFKVNPQLILYGLAGSELIKAGNKLGLQTAQEVFADRTYQPDGTLTPRNLPHALLSDPALAARQVVDMVKQGKVKALTGVEISIQADTVCIHGDGSQAVTFVHTIREFLSRESIIIRAV
ncbi:LamB/YcsF family protein [Rhodocytophaga rosea]|uniref:5-oxoprolinase subunit A n=1 Tax=Rhodocytophaga rosea TaxID=2704465 RepID=A0A6C0GMW1_9BACT|nr:5-oxoprolinase subunit PxpA [Rhodocytophaga rosea]QHT69378.1 LamB/YcsF family protein [Rhodocytophaga rosea]